MHRRNLSPAAPAGGLPTSANTSGAPVDAGALRFAHPVRLFPGLVFKGNGECSPHSTYDYLSARVALVPTLEREAPMLRVRPLRPSCTPFLPFKGVRCCTSVPLPALGRAAP
jgi:hypothetical protein